LEGDDRHPFSEAIGVVAAVAPDSSSIEIVTRRVGSVTIATGDVIAGKTFD
jgi:hypothetical protein